MARKTSNKNTKSKLRKINAQALSKKSRDTTSTRGTKEITGEDAHNNQQNQGDECNDVDCDCIKRRGQMFLPQYLLEGYDESLEKRK